MLRHVVTAGLVAGILLASASPAHAKVTKDPKTATHVLPCNDGSKKAARVWYPYQNEAGVRPKTWAVNNNCKTKWVIISMPGDSESDPYGWTVSVAPGAKFQTHDLWYADSDGAENIYLAGDRAQGCRYGWTYGEFLKRDRQIRVVRTCPEAPYDES